MSNSDALQQHQTPGSVGYRSADNWLLWLLFALVLFILFYHLGTAALFEPDEGRNSEKAREILLLNDWVTPHENFFPVLDKPIFFYWLIALAFKVFGVSEWSARLPSVLAALGCLALVYRFAHARWGKWEALWSALILITSAEFFILSRVVIFDMPLTFLTTAALYAFYEAAQAADDRRRKAYCLLLYGALGAGTLIKGLIGVVIPGMVIFFYLLLTKRWSVLKRIYLIPGALLYLAIVAPWYIQVDARNPGFLRYFIWDEHFARFTTSSFNRTERWYFFIMVAVVGFLPWSLFLPLVIKDHWKRTLDDKTLFLLLWAILPFLFFSASKSKLPHYILPIFPALSILTATTVVGMFKKPEYNFRLPLSLPWIAQSLSIFYLMLGLISPAILPNLIRQNVSHIAYFIWIYAAILGVVLASLSISKASGFWRTQPRAYLVFCLGTTLFLIIIVHMMVGASRRRSAKELAENMLPQITTATQVVIYDTRLAGMPFYLRAERPLWVITYARKQRTMLGNFYAKGARPEPTTRWGKAMFDFNEFPDRWKVTKTPLLIIIKEKNLPHLQDQLGLSPRRIKTVGEYVLLTNQ